MVQRRARWIIIGLAGMLSGPGTLPAQEQTPPKAAKSARKAALKAAPVDPRSAGAEAALSNTGEFAAQMFVFVNWPAVPGLRGVANSNANLGSATPTVWESWKNSTEIYLPNGATPSPWETISELPAGVTPPTTQQLQQQFGPTDSTWLHFLGENRMIDGQQIVDANTQILRYDVRCDQDHFNYVAHNPAGYELFNLDGQEQALADSSFTFNFPANALEVKAAWRILDSDDDDSRFWTAYGAFYDDSQQLFYAKIGLTALHLISRITPDWIWMTYEQIDNPTATYKYFLQEKQGPAGDNLTVNPQAAAMNQILLQTTLGTKFQNYRIIGWQSAATDNSGIPTILANTNIETYFPATSSCITCHNMANIGPPQQRRLNLWNSGRNGVIGRVGEIDFNAIAKEQSPNLTFKQMNYVWSLREAQPKTPATAVKPKSR